MVPLRNPKRFRKTLLPIWLGFFLIISIGRNTTVDQTTTYHALVAVYVATLWFLHGAISCFADRYHEIIKNKRAGLENAHTEHEFRSVRYLTNFVLPSTGLFVTGGYMLKVVDRIPQAPRWWILSAAAVMIAGTLWLVYGVARFRKPWHP